jgi:5-(carboxyamino)imidazole ribonucleotide mutase
MPQVAILLGSASDEQVMQGCVEALGKFGIDHELRILSAHRNPEEVAAYVKGAEGKGIRLFIAAAGMAAHLPGVIAAYTHLPVIGVPLPGSALNGVDALYAIVQMPSGVPVATVAIGSAGAKNAGVLAAQILALHDPVMREKLIEFKKNGARL